MLTARRIGYIDTVKGFAILWITWWHVPDHPDFINPSFHVPIFFFLSGAFFKAEGQIMPFIKKKINTLIVPTFFFFMLGYAVKLFITYWDTKQINASDLYSIFDILVLGHTWNVNVPLWFLLTLFMIEILMFVLCSIIKVVTKKNAIYFSAILITTFGSFCIALMILPDVHTFFEITSAMKYIFIFSIGYVFGKCLLLNIENNLYAIIICISSFSIVILYSLFKLQNSFLNAVWLQIALVSFTIFTIITVNKINGFKIFRIFEFYGKNSLIVCGANTPILILTKRIGFKLHKYYGVSMNVYGFVSALIAIGVFYFMILFLNKYMPVVTGKKPLLKV